MVINGPVARAGSILYLLSSNGINVPKIAATIITAKREKLTTRPNFAFPKATAIA